MKYYYYVRVVEHIKTGKKWAYPDKIHDSLNLVTEFSGNESPEFINNLAMPVPTFKAATAAAENLNAFFERRSELYNYRGIK